MNVLLIAPKLQFNIDTPPMPLGLLAIGTHLKKLGYNVKIFDRSMQSTTLTNLYNDFSPDIIGVSIISTRMLKDAIVVSKFFKNRDIPVVWGGIFASEIPEIILKESFVDYVSIGEGEKTWEEIICYLEKKQSISEIAGLAYKENGKVIINSERKFLSPEEIPSIDYSLINIDEYTNDYGSDIGRKMVWLYTAKGCPHQCTFCYNKAFNKCLYRRRPTESYMNEVKYLIEETPTDSIFFADEIWCHSKKDLRQRCEEIKNSGIDFTWGCFMNVGVLDREDFEYMYECGCRLIYFGIESGSQNILDKVKKPIKIDLAVSEIKACFEAGIAPFVSFIIGFPDESEEDLRKTVKILEKVSFYGKLFCYFYIPYVGSELFNDLTNKGKLRNIKNLDDINMNFPFNTIIKDSSRNLSKVPTKDLNLIYSYSLLWSFYNKPKLQNCSNLITATINGVSEFFSHNNDGGYDKKKLLVFIFGVIYTYGTAVLRAFFYRKTAKKYDLKIKRKNKK